MWYAAYSTLLDALLFPGMIATDIVFTLEKMLLLLR